VLRQQSTTIQTVGLAGKGSIEYSHASSEIDRVLKIIDTNNRSESEDADDLEGTGAAFCNESVEVSIEMEIERLNEPFR